MNQNEMRVAKDCQQIKNRNASARRRMNHVLKRWGTVDQLLTEELKPAARHFPHMGDDD
jgi:hypothetical protein